METFAGADAAVVHVSWEAARKLGGIGTVLENLLTAPAYRAQVSRHILVSPLFLPRSFQEFDPNDDPHERLRRQGEILYSSLRRIDRGGFGRAFRSIECRYNVSLVYGTRSFSSGPAGRFEAEVLLVDLSDNVDSRRVYLRTIERFSERLQTELGVATRIVAAQGRSRLYRAISQAYMRLWGRRLGSCPLWLGLYHWLRSRGLVHYHHVDDDYVYGMLLAEPAFEAVRALLERSNGRGVLLAQEYFSLPTAYKAIMDGAGQFRTLFYAAELGVVKNLVEYGDRGTRFGSDTRFYNLLRLARGQGLTMAEVFDVRGYGNFELLRHAPICDGLAAVSQLVAEELRFLDGRYAEKDIRIIPHGNRLIPCSLADKRRARDLVRRYCAKKLGVEPDVIMTRIARPDVCKAIHRDIGVCRELEQRLAGTGSSAVLLIVSTWDPSHVPEVVHRLKQEIAAFQGVCNHVTIELINQFDWPAGTELCRDDLYRATDVMFGQSMYESFGLAQLEPLSCGAICVISGVSGARSFIESVCRRDGTVPEQERNILIADYTVLNDPGAWTMERLLTWAPEDQANHQEVVVRQLGRELHERLATDETGRARLLQSGRLLAEKMSWDLVIREAFLPFIAGVGSQRRAQGGRPIPS